MKNYNKILEAINKGIKFALDDFEDQKDIQGQTNSKVNHGYGTKEWLDLMEEVVDLGLPSGTLWCKYNLDVNPNQLSKAEDQYGGYYAWGELTPKRKNIRANWESYKLSTWLGSLYKYCNDPSTGINGFTDNLTQLLPEDDAAYQFKKCHNFKFHIPTKDQCEELISYTISNVVTCNFKNMLELTSKINGNKLYFPFSGVTYSDGFYGYNYLFIPSSQLKNSRQLYCIKADIFNNKPILWNTNRCYLMNIRPVINL